MLGRAREAPRPRYPKGIGPAPLGTSEVSQVFFEPLPSVPERKQPAQPPWIGPSEAELGAAVPLRAMLASGKDVVIALTDCVAYSSGFEIGISVRSREPIENNMMGWGRPPEPGKALPDDLLRIGVQFADSRKATTIGPHGAQFEEFLAAVREGREAQPPEGPLMMQRGGGGGGRRWDQRYWVWTLPPRGTLAIACEWPAKGIPLTMHEVDADLIRDAAAKSTRLWEEGDSPGDTTKAWVSRRT